MTELKPSLVTIVGDQLRPALQIKISNLCSSSLYNLAKARIESREHKSHSINRTSVSVDSVSLISLSIALRPLFKFRQAIITRAPKY